MRSRLDNLVIHETPKSTRKPKRVFVRDMVAQKRRFEEYAEYQSSPDNTRPHPESKVPVLTSEIIDELNTWRKRISGNKLSKADFFKLRGELNKAFTGGQLKSYLSSVMPCETKELKRILSFSKPRSMARILSQVWNVKISSTKDGLLKTKIHLRESDLFLLLKNDGDLLQSWSETHSAQLKVDRTALSLDIAATEENNQTIQSSLQQFLSSIETQRVSVSLTVDWTADPAVLALLGVFISRTSPQEATLHYMASDKHKCIEARQYLRDCANLRSHRWKSAISANTDATLQESRTNRQNPPYAERNEPWSRITSVNAGMTLPSYALRQEIPRPVYANQVNARLKRGSVLNDAVILEALAIPDDLEGLPEQTSLGRRVSFGHVLNSGMSLQSFSTDIPGQFTVIESLTPVEGERPDKFTLTLYPEPRPVEEGMQLNLEVQYDPATLKFVEYVASCSSPLKSTAVRLPSHLSDVLCEITKSTPIEKCGPITEYLESCDFDLRSGKYGPSLMMNEQNWFLEKIEHSRHVRLQSGIGDHNSNLEIDWVQSQAGEIGGSRQELSISTDSQVSTTSLLSAVARIMKALDQQ